MLDNIIKNYFISVEENSNVYDETTDRNAIRFYMWR